MSRRAECASPQCSNLIALAGSGSEFFNAGTPADRSCLSTLRPARPTRSWTLGAAGIMGSVVGPVRKFRHPPRLKEMGLPPVAFPHGPAEKWGNGAARIESPKRCPLVEGAGPLLIALCSAAAGRRFADHQEPPLQKNTVKRFCSTHRPIPPHPKRAVARFGPKTSSASPQQNPLCDRVALF